MKKMTMINGARRTARRVIPAALALLLCSGAAFADEITVEKEPGFSNFTRKQDYNAGQFSDVAESDWFSQGVQSVFELSLMNGKSHTAFAPEATVKISEAISMAAKTHNIYNGGDGTLPETTSGNWYDSAVNYALSSGIIRAGDFADYDAEATRAQLAYIFSGAVPQETLAPINAVDAVTDIAARTPYAGDILTLYRAGIVSGSDASGAYRPDQSITRGEAAIILSRIASPSRRICLTPEQEKVFSTGDAENAGGGSDGGGQTSGQESDGTDKTGSADKAGASNTEKDKTGTGDPAAPAPQIFTASGGAFTLTASTSWTTGPAVSDSISLNLILPDPTAPADNPSDRNRDKAKTQLSPGAARASILGFLSSRHDAAAPLSIFHGITAKSVAEEISGDQIMPSVYFTLSGGAGACISPLLSSSQEDAQYWIITAEDGGDFVTLVGRVSKSAGMDVQNEVLSVLKSLSLR